MKKSEEMLLKRLTTLYQQRRERDDPPADGEMLRGIEAYLRREGVAERLEAGEKSPALFAYLLENELRVFRDMSAKILYNYFYRLEEKAALADLSQEIFYQARSGDRLSEEELNRLSGRLLAAATPLLDDPACCDFAQGELSEAQLDLGWLRGDRTCMSLRMGRLQP